MQPSLDDLLMSALDPEPDERLRAAADLPIGADPDDARFGEVVAMLISLTTDPDPDVRDWATMGIGCQLDHDSPAVRAALWARVGDPGADTAGEAVFGLARRRDPLAAAMVAEALESPSVAPVFLRAAAHLRDPGLAERLWEFHDPDAGEDDDVRIALRECDPELRAARDDFVLRLTDLFFTRAAAHDPSIACGVLDLDIELRVGSLSPDLGGWDAEVLRRLSGGDPEAAVRHVLAQL